MNLPVMTNLTCRHRGELAAPGVSRCHSPKLVGLKLVTEAMCGGCYYRDHEHAPAAPDARTHLLPCLRLGPPIPDGPPPPHSRGGPAVFECLHPAHRRTTEDHCRGCPDYLFPTVTPETPAEVVRQMFELPPRPQPDGWWEWPNVQDGFRRAADAAVAAAPPYPGGYDGRGVVIAGGGRYFVSAYVTVRVLRHVGCRLPVQLWHFADELTDPMRDALRPFGVECVDADAVVAREPFPFLTGHWWKGWQLKPYAIAHCPFREVLFLDADCYPTRDPESLFDWPPYRERGATFWPDLRSSEWLLPPDRWEVFGTRPGWAALESGQLLIDKAACWRELRLALWYNAHADFVYRVVWGDKDTYNVAWRRLGTHYSMPQPTAGWDTHTILQYGPDGTVLFQHRCQDKFRLEPGQFASTYQHGGVNRHNPRLAHEDACFGFLDDLRRAGLPAAAPGGVLARAGRDASPVAGPETIESMYPPVPVELLTSDDMQERFTRYFLDSAELAADPFEVTTRTARPHRKCVSVCLFKQNADNRLPNERPVRDDLWRAKYWDGLLALAGEMPHFPEWKLRVYVEDQLWGAVEAAFANHPQVERYRMRVSSVGAGPGALWRFLALADQTLDVVLVTDVDEPLTGKADYIRSFELDERSALGRLGGFESATHYLVDPPRSRVKNYATVIAGRVMSRPARWDFDVAAAMRGFMAHRRALSETARPWGYADGETPTAYNEPVGDHVYGWGSHWYMYGFDERFLKHVVYYHFARRGAVHTWADSLPPPRLSPEGACDLRHVRAAGNTTVSPHTAVRLAALQLGPDALRVAFILDEYRWVFEALLHLVHTHDAAGYCGNVYFHSTADPYCVDLVPKQVNLFHAARHATKALEVGFNAGHSAAIMLLANPRLTVRAFDTCGMAYTRPCLDFLNSVFGDRIALVEGPSQLTVAPDPEAGYDLAHLDADHTYAAVAADLASALPKCVPGATVVMDDYEPANDIGRAVRERRDLVPTDAYTLQPVLPESSHAIFRHTGR